MPIRTLIVTDVPLFLEGLERLLSAHADVSVVGSAAPGDDLPITIDSLRPDVVLVDATTVRASAMIRSFADAVPATPVVAFAIAAEDEDEVLACAEAGVAGYVARRATLDELVDVLRSAVHGEVRCPPHVMTTVFRQVAKRAPFRALTADESGFTRREAEIATLLTDGLSNKDIARRLCIKVSTVKNHVHNILEKLHVQRRGEVGNFVHSHTPSSRWLATRVRRTRSSSES